MIDDLQPPTDNLYEFLAIGSLAIAIVSLVFAFREQSIQRERWSDAQVQLMSDGYLTLFSEHIESKGKRSKPKALAVILDHVKDED